MSTIRLVLPFLAVLFFASVASAQVYYPSSSSGCVALSSDLSFGSKGGEVSKLQQFLVSQNYPGGGSWMVTGYYGAATVTALRNFQITAGLPMTGYADAQTRAAIQSRTCTSSLGGVGFPSYVPLPTYQAAPTYLPPVSLSAPTLPTPYPYAIGNPPTLGSLSLYTGVAGTLVTLYGSNFDGSTNTVRFGPSSVTAYSQNGTQLTIVVPAVPAGSYQVSVSTARGTSNSMTFAVTAGAAIPGCVAGIGNTCCSQWSHSQECGPLTISSLSPSSGSVGSAVTIYGIGFTPNNNTVHFGQGIVAGAGSFDGQSVSFTVPTVLSGFGSAQVQIADYPIYVTNAYGENSNVLAYRVTSTAGTPIVTPVIATASGPTSIAAGTSGTWTLTLQTSIGTAVTTSVRWGDENVYGGANTPSTTLLQTQQTISLTHTYQSVGVYTITFTVSTGAGSSVATATVSVGGGLPGQGGSGYLSVFSLSPASGRPGTAIVINGSGFASSDNTVHFGVGGQRNVYSGGTAIQYTIPTYVSPCDLIQSGFVCGSPVQTVTPGTYPIYVTNGAGATNILYFTVTQ